MRQGIAFIPFYSITGTGRDAGTSPDDDGTVSALARVRGVTPAQFRLAWRLYRGPHVLAIPGTGDPDHLVQNLATGALHLSADELATLETPGAS